MLEEWCVQPIFSWGWWSEVRGLIGSFVLILDVGWGSKLLLECSLLCGLGVQVRLQKSHGLEAEKLDLGNKLGKQAY